MPRVTPTHAHKPQPRKGAAKVPAKVAAARAERRRRLAGRAVRCAAVIVALGTTFVGYSALFAHVREVVAVPAAGRGITVVLADPPAWMSDAIASDICRRVAGKTAGVRASRLDAALLDAAAAALEDEPWAAEVRQVRRVGDTLYIDCAWRRPAAVVRRPASRGTVYHLVAPADGGGVLLPVNYDEAVAQTIRSGELVRDGGVRLITGVSVSPPERPGDVWHSEALSAGIAVATLLHGRVEAGDVTEIDVSALSQPGLRNTQTDDTSPVVLRTRHGTDIYWGASPLVGDFLVEPRPSDKLAGLGLAHKAFSAGGGSWPVWVDLRHDRPLYPHTTAAHPEN